MAIPRHKLRVQAELARRIKELLHQGIPIALSFAAAQFNLGDLPKMLRKSLDKAPQYPLDKIKAALLNVKKQSLKTYRQYYKPISVLHIQSIRLWKLRSRGYSSARITTISILPVGRLARPVTCWKCSRLGVWRFVRASNRFRDCYAAAIGFGTA